MIHEISTIFNYDKDNGFSSIFNVFSDDKVGTIAKVSDEVENLFDNLDGGSKFKVLLDDFYDADKFNDVSFKKWVEGLDDLEIRSMTASGALDKYKASLSSASQSTSKFSTFTSKAGSVLKSFATGALNMGAGLLIGMAVSAAIEGIDYLIHYQDRLIEKGEEAKSAINETFDEFFDKKSSLDSLGKQFADNASDIETTADAIDSLAKKYATLRDGVNKLNNENQSLSDEEYQNYLDISNKLAEQYPSIVSSYDMQGNAILNLGNNAKSAAEDILELYNVQQRVANLDMESKLKDAYKSIEIKNKRLQNQTDSYEEQQNAYEQQKKDYEEEDFSAYSMMPNRITFDTQAFGNKWSEVKDYVESKLDDYGIGYGEYADETGFHFTTPEGLTDDQQKSLSSAIDNFAEQQITYLDGRVTELEGYISENENAIKENWHEYADLTKSYLQTSSDFTNLDVGLQNAVLGNLGNLDYSQIEKKYNGEPIDFIQKELLDPLSDMKPKVQESLSNLLELDSGDLKLSEYQDKINKALEKAFPEDSETQNKMRSLFGFDNLISESKQKLDQLRDIYGSAVNDLTMDDLDYAYDLVVNDEFSGTFDELKSKISVVQSAEETMASYSSAVEKATQNLTDLKDIMSESFTGTGMTKESVDAFREMFGDDAEKALEKTANGFHVNKTALAELQRQQDQTTKSDYLSALSDQYELLRENTKDLAEATFSGGDTSGLEATRQSILDQITSLQELQYQYDTASTAYSRWQDAMSGGSERDMYESIQSGYENVKDLIKRGWGGSDEVRNYVDLLSSEDLTNASSQEIETAFNNLQKEIGNSGYSILDFFTVDEDGNSTTDGIYNLFDTVQSVLGEEYAKLEDGKYTFDFGLGKDQDVAEALGMDVEALQSILRAASDAGFEVHIDQPLYSLEELKTSAQEAKQALADMGDSSLSEINLDSSSFGEITNSISQVEDYIDNLEEDTTIGENVRTDKLEEANALLEYLVQLQEAAGQTIDVSVDANELNAEIDQAWNKLNEFKEEDGSIPINADTQSSIDNLTRLLSIKEQLEAPAVMNVDTSKVNGDLGTAIAKIQEYQSALQQLSIQKELQSQGVEIDTSSAEQKVSALEAEIMGLDPEITTKLGINMESTESLQSSIQAITPEVMIEAGIDESAIVGYKAPEKTAKVKFEKDSTEPDKYQPEDKDAWVKYKADPASIATLPTTFTPVVRKVLYSAVGDTGGASSSPTNVIPHVNGGSHVNGTMVTSYQFHNFSGKAAASGDMGIQKDEDGLIGELGPELLVRGSRFTTIGDNGAEFVHLKKGDIIFNHEQTKSLLKNGYVTSRGKMIGGNAHAHGTLRGNAYSYGNGPSRRPSVTSYAMDGSVSNYHPETATDKNTKATDANTKATEKETEKKEKSVKTFDWVQRRLEYFSNKTKAIADTITDYVSSAFKTIQLKRQMKAIDKEITANEKGANAYTKKANSVAKRYEYYDENNNLQTVSVSAKYKNLVKSGKWKIEDMDTSTEQGKALADAIEQYQSYYDSAQECRQAVVDLKNEQLELFEQWANMPTEKAEKKIDKLSKKFNILSSSYDAVSIGESTASQLSDMQLEDYSSALLERKTAKSKLNKAKKNTQKAKANLSKKQRKQANKGGKVSTKGLKGNALKRAKEYNKALARQNKARNRLSQASYIYEEMESVTELARNYSDSVSYEYSNALIDQQIQNQRQQDVAYQNAYQQSVKNTQSTKSNMSSAKSQVSKRAKSILNNHKLAKELSKQQKENLKARKKVSTKGLDGKVLKRVKQYNKLVEQSKTATQKYNIALEAQSTAAENAATSQAELAQAIVEAEQQKFENVSQYYEQQMAYQKALIEQEEAYIKLKEAQGYYLSQSDYEKQKESVRKQQQLQKEQIEKLQNQLNSSVASGVIKQGSLEWLEMQTQIEEAKNALADYNVEMANITNDARIAKYEEMFDRVIEKSRQFINSLETINDLITDEMMYDYDTGFLTETGALSLLLNKKNFDEEIQNLQKLTQKSLTISLQYKAEMFGDKEYEEQMNEVQSDILSSISDLDSIRKSILDIVKNQTEAELDVIIKSIDKWKEALQKKKDYYDYDKTLKSQTKEVNALKQQIAALDGVTDARSRAEKQRLEAQLAEAQEDLDDTVKDHVYELQISGLDELKDILNEDYEKYLHELSASIDNMTNAINNAVDQAAASTTDVLKLIDKLLEPYGLSTDYIGITGTGGIKGFASGTKKVSKDGTYLTQENGREIIVTKDGILTPLKKGDGVVPNDLTERIFKMAQEYPMHDYMKDAVTNVNVPLTESKQYSMSCSIGDIILNGNSSNITARDLTKFRKDIVDNALLEIRKDMGKIGAKRVYH